VEQLLRPKLPIDKGDALSIAFATFVQEWAIGVWSGPCALTLQLTILVDQVLFVMIENRLGKNLLCSQQFTMFTMLWSEVFKHVSWSIVWIHHWLNQYHDYWLQNDKSQFHTAYVCVEVFMKLANLLQCKFLILVSFHDDYRELLQLTVLFLCDIPPSSPCTVYGLQSYAQRLVDDQVVLCMCEHFGILTAIQNNSSQLGVERWAFLMPVLHTSWTLCTSPAAAPARMIFALCS